MTHPTVALMSNLKLWLRICTSARLRSGSVRGPREIRSGFVRGLFRVRVGSVWDPFEGRAGFVRDPFRNRSESETAAAKQKNAAREGLRGGGSPPPPNGRYGTFRFPSILPNDSILIAASES